MREGDAVLMCEYVEEFSEFTEGEVFGGEDDFVGGGLGVDLVIDDLEELFDFLGEGHSNQINFGGLCPYILNLDQSDSRKQVSHISKIKSRRLLKQGISDLRAFLFRLVKVELVLHEELSQGVSEVGVEVEVRVGHVGGVYRFFLHMA